MQNQNEKENETKFQNKYYRAILNGKIQYRMVDLKKLQHGFYYTRSKPCHLELESKTLVALNPDKDKTYGFFYKYRIVEDKDEKFQYMHGINKDVLIDGEYVTNTKLC